MKKLLVACVFILSACNETSSVSNETKQASISVEPPTASEPTIECDGIIPNNNLIMDVIGNEHLLYTLPDDKAPAVVNNKASEIFGRIEYHVIDTSTRVQIHCDKGKWVFVQLTSPDWLTDVKGWTKHEYLKPLQASVGEPTKALDSKLSLNNRSSISTSEGLSKADLAWHAINTYGLDCAEVIAKSKTTKEGYFLITCSNGKELRIYLRNGQHPYITEK
jgi:hypothetical protein